MPAAARPRAFTGPPLPQTGEKREIHHFHYTTWPDFGVPESPASFLNFLFKVRESGALGMDHGPAVVHCSAGIGRSGTFSLVDSCVVLVSPFESLSLFPYGAFSVLGPESSHWYMFLVRWTRGKTRRRWTLKASCWT